MFISSQNHTEELQYFYSLPNIIRAIKSRTMKWEKHEMRNDYKIFVRNPEGKRPLRRPKYRRENNIKIDLTESVERFGMDSSSSWVLVSMVMNLWVSQKVSNFLST
jgi:hypothetical protein